MVFFETHAMKTFIDKIIKYVKGHDFRIFIICLGLSLLIWSIEKLRQVYTVTFDYTIVGRNAPDNYIVDANKIPTAKVAVSADGFNLLFFSHREKNISIDIKRLRVTELSGVSYAILPTANYRRLVSDRLPDYIELQNIVSDTIFIPLLTKREKRLPVVVRDEVSLENQHCFSRPTLVRPDTVTVSGTNDVIDTMTAVYTTQQVPMKLKDTLAVVIPFELPLGAYTDEQNAEVTYFVEPYTEKTLNVPITAINVPAGYTFKAFPAAAHVTFFVGLSQFEKVGTSDFDIIADLTDVKPGASQPQTKLKLIEQPGCVSNVSYSPLFVEYLLERNHEIWQ